MAILLNQPLIFLNPFLFLLQALCYVVYLWLNVFFYISHLVLSSSISALTLSVSLRYCLISLSSFPTTISYTCICIQLQHLNPLTVLLSFLPLKHLLTSFWVPQFQPSSFPFHVDTAWSTFHLPQKLSLIFAYSTSRFKYPCRPLPPPLYTS